jgi:AcrR family transcriptional regulator
MSDATAKGILAPSERERILRATAALCAERGYQEITFDDVIERSGVSEEKFSELFGGMEEAALGAINWLLGETIGAVSAAYSADRSELESALAGVKAILELMAANPSYAYLGYVTVRQMGTETMREVHDTGIQMLSVMLDRLRQYAQTTSQPGRTAVAALGGAEAVIRRELVDGRSERLPALLPDLIYAATAPYLGTEVALTLGRKGREMLRGTAWE